MSELETNSSFKSFHEDGNRLFTETSEYTADGNSPNSIQVLIHRQQSDDMLVRCYPDRIR